MLCSDSIRVLVLYAKTLFCLLSHLYAHACFVSARCMSLPVLFRLCLGVCVASGFRRESLYEPSFYPVSLVRKRNRGWPVNFSGNNRVSRVSIAFYNMNHTSLPAHLSCFCLPCITRLKKHWKWWRGLPRNCHVLLDDCK